MKKDIQKKLLKFGKIEKTLNIGKLNMLDNGKFEQFGKMKHGKLKKWNSGKPYGTIWYHVVP